MSIPIIFAMLNVSIGGPGCWEHHDPRGAVKVPKIGVRPYQTMRACHAVAEAAHGPRPAGLMLCHWCDNRKCLRPDHLYYGTAQDNSLDAWRNGRRTMSTEQLERMQEGLRKSPKHAARMIEHNRELAARNRGDAHWTRKDEESMTRWKAAIAASRTGGDAR